MRSSLIILELLIARGISDITTVFEWHYKIHAKRQWRILSLFVSLLSLIPI